MRIKSANCGVSCGLIWLNLGKITRWQIFARVNTGKLPMRLNLTQLGGRSPVGKYSPGWTRWQIFARWTLGKITPCPIWCRGEHFWHCSTYMTHIAHSIHHTRIVHTYTGKYIGYGYAYCRIRADTASLECSQSYRFGVITMRIIWTGSTLHRLLVL